MNSEPTKLDRRKEIRELRAENASLKEQVVTLEKLQGVALIESLRAEVAERREDHMKLVEENHELRQQLSISQLEAKRLRESPATKLIVEAYDFGQFSDDFNQPQARSVRKAIREFCEALSPPTSTEALDAYVAEKVKESKSAIDYEFTSKRLDRVCRLVGIEQPFEDYKLNIEVAGTTLAIVARKLEQLTRQRDLAVSAATKARNGAHQAAMVCPKKLHVYPALLNMIDVVDDALAAIKESEV